MSTLFVSLRRKSATRLKKSLNSSKARFRALLPGETFLCAFFTIVFFAATSQSLFAELIVKVGNAQVTEGGSGYFDVFFSIPQGTTQTYDLAAYMVELTLTGPTTKVHFTQLAEPQNAVFPGRTPQSGSTLPGATVVASDDLPKPPGSYTIVDNAGLIRVNFTTESGSAGVYNVAINSNLAHTNFTNNNADLLSSLTTVSYVSGNITVPEPSVIFMLITIVPLIFYGRLRFLK